MMLFIFILWGKKKGRPFSPKGAALFPKRGGPFYQEVSTFFTTKLYDLFYGNGFCQITRHIHVASFLHGNVVGQ